MADLLHDFGRGSPEREEQRGVGAAHGVKRQRRRQGAGVISVQRGVGSLDCAVKHALADVGRVLPAATAGAEDQVAAAGMPLSLEDAELLAQDGNQVDLSDAGGGLGVTDAQAPERQIDVLPAQIEKLPDAQPREDEGGKDCVPVCALAGSSFAIERGGGL